MIWPLFRDNQGVITGDYPKEGRTINGTYYAKELRWLCQEIMRKRRAKLTQVAHTSQVAVAASTECCFKALP